MFLAEATYTSKKFGEQHIRITNKKAEENIDAIHENETLHVYYTAPIVDKIMQTAASENLPAEFNFNNVSYQLIQYKALPEEQKYNKYRIPTNIIIKRIASKAEIYVYTDRCRCTKCYYEYGWDNIEDICGCVNTIADKNKKIFITMHRCKRCNKYFIDQPSLEYYDNKYGKLDIARHNITGNERPYVESNDIYNEDTILSRHGYSTQLPKFQRRQIIKMLLDNNISSKTEIKDILTRFIKQREARCPQAGQIWRSDLQFVNAYNIKKQECVEFD